MTTATADLRLSQVLSAGRVEVGFRAPDMPEAVDRLLSPLLLAEGFTPEGAKEAVEAVMVRERSGSTAVGPVGLPHARLGGLGRIVAALGLNPGGIFDGEESRKSILLVFASPQQAATEHLRFLAGVAKIFRNDAAVGELLAAPDADGVLAALRARE